jgi:hypothetical protein
VKLAFVDAMHHIKELTGSWFLPHQLQTDRWGNGTLTEFYQAIATYTPATAKVARAKFIERAFGTEVASSFEMSIQTMQETTSQLKARSMKITLAS